METQQPGMPQSQRDAADARRPWATPRVIESQLVAQETENLYGGGVDGGPAPATHS